MNGGKTVAKIAPALGLRRLFSSPCLKATHSPRCLSWGTGVVTEACLVSLKLAIRLRRPRYPKEAAPTGFQTVKTTTDRSSSTAMPSTDASAQRMLPAPMPTVVKEAARRPARSACSVIRAVSGPGIDNQKRCYDQKGSKPRVEETHYRPS